MFTEMDPEVVWKLVEGYQNELEPEYNKMEAFYRQFDCPRCGGTCRKEFVANHAFSDPDALIARALLRCTLCSCLFNPHVLVGGEPMILELGNIAAATSKR